jgi:polyisoprenoid-binding protein YceI
MLLDSNLSEKCCKEASMKTLLSNLILLTAALAASAASFSPSGSLKVEGDSTLHKWSLDATSMTMVVDADPAALSQAVKAGAVKTMELRISVAGLRSGESGLDKNMRKAMDADKYPEVSYKLERYELAPAGADGTVVAKTTGQLTIAGQTRPVTMDVEFRFGPDGAKAKGSYNLKMSDYGIKPPTLMLGTIKVRDPVTIRFDMNLTQKENKP